MYDAEICGGGAGSQAFLEAANKELEEVKALEDAALIKAAEDKVRAATSAASLHSCKIREENEEPKGKCKLLCVYAEEDECRGSKKKWDPITELCLVGDSKNFDNFFKDHPLPGFCEEDEEGPCIQKICLNSNEHSSTCHTPCKMQGRLDDANDRCEADALKNVTDRTTPWFHKMMCESAGGIWSEGEPIDDEHDDGIGDDDDEDDDDGFPRQEKSSPAPSSSHKKGNFDDAKKRVAKDSKKKSIPVDQWGFTPLSNVRCNNYYMKPVDADKDNAEQRKDALLAHEITKEECDVLVEALKMEARTKVELLSVGVGRPITIADDGGKRTCGVASAPDKLPEEQRLEAWGKPELDNYQCAMLMAQFSQLHSFVFDGEGKVNTRFRRFFDLTVYGTPGPTACTDMHFCQSEEAERRVLMYFRVSERLTRMVTEFDQVEKSAGRPGYNDYLKAVPSGEDGKTKPWFSDTTGESTKYMPPGWEDSKAHKLMSESLNPTPQGNPLYLPMSLMTKSYKQPGA
jgi:hypothetical protein